MPAKLIQKIKARAHRVPSPRVTPRAMARRASRRHKREKEREQRDALLKAARTERAWAGDANAAAAAKASAQRFMALVQRRQCLARWRLRLLEDAWWYANVFGGFGDCLRSQLGRNESCESLRREAAAAWLLRVESVVLWPRE